MIVLLLLACDTEPLGTTFEDDIAAVLRAECVECHSASRPEGGLDLGTDGWGALVEAESAQSDLLLVQPGDHLYSYLWHKVNGTQSLAGGSGTRMPMDQALDEDLVQLIADWIDEGARP